MSLETLTSTIQPTVPHAIISYELTFLHIHMLADLPLWLTIVLGIAAFAIVFFLLKKVLKIAVTVVIAIVAAAIVIFLFF